MNKVILNALLNLEKNKSVVEKFEYKNKNYIIKKNLEIYTIKDVKNKQKTLKKLSKNNINVAKIVKVFKFNNNIYEIQEFIDGNNYESKFKKELYNSLGKMHKLSTKSKLPCSTKNFYHFNFECRNIKLNKLLIDFEYKFYKIPEQNLEKIINENFNIKKTLNEILNEYTIIFNEEKNKINNNNIVLCHNDLSDFNVLVKNNEIYFIDFDFYKYNYVYCDLVDAFLSRKLELVEFLNNFNNFKKDMLEIIDIYNKYISINYKSFLNCIKLKLISSYFYFIYYTENKEERTKNIEILSSILKL